MKKRVVSLLMAGALALTLAGCGGDESSDKGAVYYLNFKPEQDQQWKDLAKVYTDQTGVEVTVVTAASGSYEQTLMSEIAKSKPPTLFQVNGPVGLAGWKDYCYDLTGTALEGELTSEAYALKEDGQTLGIAYVVESYGIIVNKTLLAQTGHSVEDIQSFGDLKRVSEDITARKGELGFAAFTSAGTDGSSDWRFKTHLANLPLYFEYQDRGMGAAADIQGTYLDAYKDIFDLYIHNSTCDPAQLSGKTGDDALNEFRDGKAVFYQNGSWAYSDLTAPKGPFTDDDLAMIPIYIGVGDEADQGLCTGTENYWCINKEAREADIQATLDFATWCVTSSEGVHALGEEMGFVIPFQKALESPNLFVRQDAQYTAQGKTPVSWNFPTMPSENWKNAVGNALTAYAAGTGDWEAVRSAFVEGWAREYAAMGGGQ